MPNTQVDMNQDPTKILQQLIKINTASLGPYQKGVNKRLEEMGMAHVDEAVQGGVDPRQVQSQAGLDHKELLSNLLKQSPITQSDQAQSKNPTQDQSVNQMPQGNFIQKFFDALPGGQERQLNRQSTSADISLKNQEINLGGKSNIELQKEKYKSDLESQKEQKKLEAEQQKERQSRMNSIFDPILSPKPIDSTTANNLSFIENSLTALDNMNNILGINYDDKTGTISVKNKDKLKDPVWLSKNRQELIRARDIYINKSLRRDTGAAIGKDEEKAFRKTFGFDVGVKSWLKNPEIIAKSLVESQQQLMRDRSRLLPNEQRDNEIKMLLKQGFTKEDIFNEYEKRGEL